MGSPIALLPALKMSGISKNFGATKALKDVSFLVKRGTVHALCGENGAGKSTLMKILAGVHMPDSGVLEVDGINRQFKTPGEAIEAGVSMIYQELDLAEHLSVCENVFLGAEPMMAGGLLLDHRAMVSMTEKLANDFGFEVNPLLKISDLSPGDRQIAELLKAIRRKAYIIVMDEPTSSLSAAEAEGLLKTVEKLRAAGKSVIYISHRLEEVMRIADDISILRDGQLVGTGEASSFNSKTLVRQMVGRELGDFYPTRETKPGKVLFKVENLSSSDGFPADISFEIRAGEVLGMAGLVGAGRTETAELIFGVREKRGGLIEIEGRRQSISSPAEAIAAGIAYLTEDRRKTGLCLGLPCFWNITLATLSKIGMKWCLNPAKETKIACEKASSLNVKWASPDAPASSLSGGNQQKLLIARWMLADAKVVILDEPTRGVDVGAKKEIYTIINAMAAEGKAILLISSELPEIFGVADRILVMREGNIAGVMDKTACKPDDVMELATLNTNNSGN